MKARDPTGKGYYKEYYGAPKWFGKMIGQGGNGSLLNVAACTHYIGRGMDGKKKDWYSGVFLNDFELSDPYWEQKVKKADFIIHFDKEYNHDGI
jgi:hypothetical protein